MSQSSPRRLASLAVAACMAVALAALLSAQKPSVPQQQPTFKAGINFVRVDVYPTLNGKVVPDLRQDEFEVLEDGVPQRIESFERIVIRTPGLEVDRAEPRTVAEANQAAGDARNRLFVVFLDTYHTRGDSPGQGSSLGVMDRAKVQTSALDNSRFGRQLAQFLQKLIGDNDLVGLMRPEMPASALTFTRRPSSFEEFLTSGGLWQRRFSTDLDDIERHYVACYPTVANASGTYGDIAGAMIARRRERMVLDSLRSLVGHLQTLREERKAILVVTEGWMLFRPDRTLEAEPGGAVPGPPPIGVDRGKPTFGDPRELVSRRECERDRRELAALDDERDFRTLLDDANRANASFYPIDPRGLPVFDAPLPGGSVIEDYNNLKTRLESMMTMASATDGVPIVNSNDITKNLRRISDDLSGYYLIGYNSSNAKADGKFRKISVRVKRPGVAVRARRGYNAPTEADVAAVSRAAAPVDAATRSRDAALANVADIRADRTAYLAAGYRWEPANTGVRPALWIAGELSAAAARLPEWSRGGKAAVVVTNARGETIVSQSATVTTIARTFVMQVTDQVAPGDYLVKLRVEGAPGSGADAGAQIRVSVPEPATASMLGQPMLYRRGPYTGSGYQPTADARFRKAERVRVDLPLVIEHDSVIARLLDRRGQPLAVPVTVAARDEGTVRFATAEVAVAPLAQGDYLVEIAVRRGDKEDKVMAAFRVIP